MVIELAVTHCQNHHAVYEQGSESLSGLTYWICSICGSLFGTGKQIPADADLELTCEPLRCCHRLAIKIYSLRNSLSVAGSAYKQLLADIDIKLTCELLRYYYRLINNIKWYEYSGFS